MVYTEPLKKKKLYVLIWHLKDKAEKEKQGAEQHYKLPFIFYRKQSFASTFVCCI